MHTVVESILLVYSGQSSWACYHLESVACSPWVLKQWCLRVWWPAIELSLPLSGCLLSTPAESLWGFVLTCYKHLVQKAKQTLYFNLWHIYKKPLRYLWKVFLLRIVGVWSINTNVKSCQCESVLCLCGCLFENLPLLHFSPTRTVFSKGRCQGVSHSFLSGNFPSSCSLTPSAGSSSKCYFHLLHGSIKYTFYLDILSAKIVWYSYIL